MIKEIDYLQGAEMSEEIGEEWIPQVYIVWIVLVLGTKLKLRLYLSKSLNP